MLLCSRTMLFQLMFTFVHKSSVKRLLFCKKSARTPDFYDSGRGVQARRVHFWRRAFEWLCTASTSAVTCSGGVN